MFILQSILGTIREQMASSSWGGGLVSLEKEKEQPLLCSSLGVLPALGADTALRWPASNLPRSNVSLHLHLSNMAGKVRNAQAVSYL